MLAKLTVPFLFQFILFDQTWQRKLTNMYIIKQTHKKGQFFSLLLKIVQGGESQKGRGLIKRGRAAFLGGSQKGRGLKGGGSQNHCISFSRNFFPPLPHFRVQMVTPLLFYSLGTAAYFYRSLSSLFV